MTVISIVALLLVLLALGLMRMRARKDAAFWVQAAVAAGMFCLSAVSGAEALRALPKFEGMMLCLGLTFLLWSAAGCCELFDTAPRNTAPIVGLGVIGAACLFLAFFVLTA